MTKWALLAVFGAIGTIARVATSAAVQRAAGPGFPWGTVSVNLLGSFFFGLVWAAAESNSRSVDIRFFALTGFMGAFTTFSTLMFDTERLAEASRHWAVAGNLLLQNGVGLVLIVVGLAVGRGLQ